MRSFKRKTDNNKERWFNRKKAFPALIVFMVIFLVVSVAESILYYRDSKVNAADSVVSGDGKFDIPKCNSDSEKGSKDKPFVVLEIVPGASSAQFGYLVGGQEPIDIEKALKEDPTAKDVLSKYVEIGEDGVSYTNTELFKKFGIGLAYKDNDIANGEEISKFEFGGWYLEEECVNPVDADMRLTKDTTVYAKWTAVYPTDEINRVAGKEDTYKPQYTVKFDANCGDAQDSVIGMPEDIKHIEEDSTIVEPYAVPKRKDKLFAGWFTNKECTKSYSFNDRLSGKEKVITLYAKWVDMPDVKFTLKFEPNAEGVSDMPDIIENYAKNGMGADFADVTPQIEPKMAGYSFTGWYYDSACTRKFEFASTIPDDIENNLAADEKVISLYAG
ncbi:MAG: InlB B-repeat-containing protein, partial [Lachnospiraceae bacterium]|nr:InlB B-repeat-containing protein [Lachnospiraceae bacterium]